MLVVRASATTSERGLEMVRATLLQAMLLVKHWAERLSGTVKEIEKAAFLKVKGSAIQCLACLLVVW
jgi:hypothetical protein